MLWRAGQSLLGGEHVTNHIGAKYVLERNRVARRRNIRSCDFTDGCDHVNNLAKFTREVFNFAVGEVDAG